MRLLAYLAAAPLVTGWFGYRQGLRRDERQWSRARRADLYIDLIAEVGSDMDWFGWKLAHEAAKADVVVGQSSPFTYLGLSPGDRRRLDARTLGIASEEVRRRWDAFYNIARQEMSPENPLNPAGIDALGVAAIARARTGKARDSLARQIRLELHADRLRFGEGTRWLGWGYRLGRRSD